MYRFSFRLLRAAYRPGVLAAGLLALALSGCGSDTEPTDTSVTSSVTSAAAETSSSTATQTLPAGSVSASVAPSMDPATAESRTTTGQARPASETICGEFNQLDPAAQRTVITEILAAHPESSFAGSPNVALGTANLVCDSGEYADTPVAQAAGLTTR